MNRKPAFLLVAGAMALALLLLVPRLHAPIGFDGKFFYLPMARAVLEQGWAYMAKPESVAYAPLSFLYPALLGANELLVREANIALYCAAILIAYFALKAASGTRAGVLGAFLLAISPTLRPYIADVMTEPPFVFLVAAWALSVARLAAGARAGWAVAGGVALALATLVRPAAMYFAPCAMIFFAWRRQWPLAALHGIASIAVALWVLRNAIVFGFPTVAAGAGAALYFGVNPLVDGFDPAYYGMGFDSGLAQDGTSHLSIHGDRTLGAIARIELLDTPLGVLVPMFAHKLLAFLFVTSSETSGEPLAWLRAWRIVTVMLALVAVARGRRSAFVLATAGLVTYMVAVHVPLLYAHRYSVGAIDLPLALLAALGVIEVSRDAKHIALALVAGTLAVGIGLVALSTAGPGAPMPERIPHEIMWLAHLDGEATIAPGAPLDIAITKSASSPLWDLSMLQLDLAIAPAVQGSCKAMRVRFRRSAEDRFADYRVVRIPIDADGATHRYTIGSTVPLALDGAGTLRIELECGSAAAVRVGTIAIIAPRREIHYRDRYLETRRAPSPQ